jgi:DNA polymerase-3 subunit alpha
MKNIDFAHLHIHNEFSQLDGYGTAKAYVERAEKMGFKYLGLTNHGNMDGLIKFQQECEKSGIIPILGCEGYMIPDRLLQTKTRKRGHVCLWVKNQTGFENLCNLLSYANLEGFYYRPRFTYSKLLEHSEGLVISTACLISWTNLFKDGVQFFYDLKDQIGDDLYCEIMPHMIKKQIIFNRKMRKLAKESNSKIITTNDCHYVERREWRSQEILLAIQRKAKWTDKDRWKFGIRGLYLRSADDMIRMLRKTRFFRKEYLHNTLEIAEKCAEYTIPKREVQLPRVKGVGLKEAEFLEDLCAKGYQDKFGHSLYGNRHYYERFEEEFKLIKKKKFVRYFLIVWELVNWCRTSNILLGPGRGSVGGSLIAYLIGITSVDPIKFNLLFNRFIKEDRIDYPDIDIDFEHTKRTLVQKHLETLYGQDKIANVSSFNRMKARAAVQDVARVFDVPAGEVNRFTKLIEDNDEHTGIEQAISTYEEGREFKKNYPNVIRQAKKLEGQVRGYSQHAAAIVLSQDPIASGGRCNLLKRKDTLLVNWEKEDTEYVGLMKLDALGLKLLSILADTIKLVKENYDKSIDLETLNLEDKVVLKEISSGNTTGLFQLGAYATASLIKDMGVEKFMDISDAVALARPGPANSGMTADYVQRKRRRGKWEKRHEVYEKITADTFGLLVYQEQVMSVIHEVAGLPYHTADKIRKIIGKKRDPKEFEAYKRRFLKGCKKEQIFSKDEAEEFWEGLQEWAHYGFNRAHSVEYAMLGYWCAWLKKYYPTEFICASLAYGAKDKKSQLVEEAYRLGLTLVTPKVQLSDPKKWVAKDKKLYIPFIEIKGLGDVKAHIAAVSPNKKKGIKKFFNKKEEPKIVEHDGALGALLKEINAYSQDEPAQQSVKIRELFDFRVVTNPRDNYRRLYELYNNKIRLDRLDPIIEGDRKSLRALANHATKKIIRHRTFKGFENILSCSACDLHKECTRPVPPSPGQYNIAFIGQDPGYDEDQQGKGFVGRSGDLIWANLQKRGYERPLFHITNVNKCYPKHSRKSSKQQIKICSQLWLTKELQAVKPIVILAFGASALYFLTGRTGGITELSGKVQWIEQWGAWVVWCLHPAATLHNPDSKHLYVKGMNSFCKLVHSLAPELRK